ncbi:MAG: S8 family serine peptidase [Niastella sp.]|nr:S8 family serine peptidase [Niastella sp.]
MAITTDQQKINYRPLVKSLDRFGDKNLIQMDPKLQQAIILRRSGARDLLTVAVAFDEIAVLAKVSTFDQWVQCSDVRGAYHIAPAPDGTGEIVTGRIPISRVEAIRVLPFVKSLKAARKLNPALRRTALAMEFPPQPAPPATFKGGKGVLVGVVDSGCDFAHQNFQVKGKTRLRKLWDQRVSDILPNGLPGKVYTAEEINKALKKTDPYTALGYRPGKRAHGTHVMDIAAGNGAGTGVPGIAPEAELIFVHVSAHDIAWQGENVIEQSFGDSVNLVEAIRFIFEEAGDQPCVVNISLGTNGGPHDGTTLVEQSIDSLLTGKPNRCVVIAAANSYEHGIHAMGHLAPGAIFDLPWVIHANDPSENELDLWYPGVGKLSVELIAPGEESLGIVMPGEAGSVNDTANSPRAAVSNRTKDSGNDDNNIGIWLNGNQGGSWIVRLQNIGDQPTSFHAWVERDDAGQSNFGTAHDSRYTLGSISCAKKALTVGAFDATVANSPVAFFSSSGPTRDEREKPEIAAPGAKVIAARSETGNGAYPESGTSMASPAVCGCIALLYARALHLGKDIDIDTLRKYVLASGLQNPPANVWHPRYGYGRLSAKKLLAYLEGEASAGTSTKAKPGSGPKKGVKKQIKTRQKAAPKKTGKKVKKSKQKR